MDNRIRVGGVYKATWTRRVKWFGQPDGRVKIKFEDESGVWSRMYPEPSAAQADWERFKSGEITYTHR